MLIKEISEFPSTAILDLGVIQSAISKDNQRTLECGAGNWAASPGGCESAAKDGVATPQPI